MGTKPVRMKVKKTKPVHIKVNKQSPKKSISVPAPKIACKAASKKQATHSTPFKVKNETSKNSADRGQTADTTPEKQEVTTRAAGKRATHTTPVKQEKATSKRFRGKSSIPIPIKEETVEESAE